MRSATVELSSTQILNSNTTPVEILPAPGPGKYLILFATFSKLHFGTAPYNLFAAPVASIGPTINNHEITAASQSQMASAADNIEELNHGVIGVPAGPAADFENQAAAFYTPVLNPYGGDGTLTLTIWYEIVPKG